MKHAVIFIVVVIVDFFKSELAFSKFNCSILKLPYFPPLPAHVFVFLTRKVSVRRSGRHLE
jgi:hypothetical protein